MAVGVLLRVPAVFTYKQGASLAFFGEFMQDFAKPFYKSKTWQKCRENYVKKTGGLCEECLKHGRYTPAEIVHHKVHITPHNIYNPEVTLNFENLESLCRKCHGERHGSYVRRYVVDELGRVEVR